jgi:aspartate aminotransferase
VEALTGSQKFVQDLCAEYRRRRDYIHAALIELPEVSCAQPGGGFYVFPNVGRYLGTRIPTTVHLARRLLDEHRVAVVPGEGFGATGYLRISFARPIEELRDGLHRLSAFLEGLRSAS